MANYYPLSDRLNSKAGLSLAKQKLRGTCANKHPPNLKTNKIFGPLNLLSTLNYEVFCAQQSSEIGVRYRGQVATAKVFQQYSLVPSKW